MINCGIRGISMNTKDLKVLVSFFKRQGISPTVKELCSQNMQAAYYLNIRTL